MVGFSSQHLLGLLNFFFFLTRVIKLLIIYLILKIINILIYREDAVRFVRFSYYKTANHTAPCSMVWYDALLLAVWLYHFAGGLVQFVRFMQFGEHPYMSD